MITAWFGGSKINHLVQVERSKVKTICGRAFNHAKVTRIPQNELTICRACRRIAEDKYAGKWKTYLEG